MKRPKITLIGAGSVVFAKTLLGDILQFPELSDSTICLMDIDPARLKVAKIMAERMVAKLKVKARIEATANQREAVRGAKYVICTIQVGGYRPGTVIDFEIPRKYGLLQTIADTLGVGGVFRALRTIPVINSIGRDMAEVGAPGCLLLNYTNPMAMNCWAFSREIGLPHVGLCHSVQGTSRQLASYTKLPYEDVTYLVAGINHMAFFLKFAYKGRDAYPLLFKALEDPQVFARDKVRFEMMRRTGYFVTESSEHQSEYVPYFIHHGKKLIEQFDIPIDEYLRRCESVMATWKSTEADLLGESRGEIYVAPQGHEYGSYIINACETGRPTVIYGNVPNTGLITNLPAGCCVEVPCLIDAQGVQPTHIGALPPQLAALCQTNINVQALTVEAALTGKREHIYHAVMLDPHTATVLNLDQIWRMCDELIEAHQKEGLLGEFKPVIPNTGRTWAGTGDRITAVIEPVPVTGKEKKGEVPLRLTVSNPQQKAVEFGLDLRCTNGGDASILGPERFNLRLGAGKTLTKPFKIRLNPEDREECVVSAAAGRADVLVKDLRLKPRARFHTGGDGASFKLQLAGFPAAEGTLSTTAQALQLDLRVQDSKIASAFRLPAWRQPGIELFLSQDALSPIRQLFLVPVEGKKSPVTVWAAEPKSKAQAKVAASIRIDRTGYRLQASIPWQAAGLKPDTPFLFDVYARIGALGDAHSGGLTSLSGKLNSHADSGHYAQALA